MERLTFALVTAAHKLKPYFQTHTVIVLTDKTLRQAMSNSETTERVALWAIELSEFDIHYRPHTAIKGQVVKEVPQWSIHTDGSSNKQAGGAGVILHSPKGDKIECMVRLDFPMTNSRIRSPNNRIGPCQGRES